MTASTFAQSPEKMSYQAVVRDSGNAIVGNQTVGMQLSILQGSTAVYVETQTPTTNANGLVSIAIGMGSVISGDFSAIDWSVGPYFIKTETDPTGPFTNYTITGTSQLLSVPFALHAKTAETAETANNGIPAGGTEGQVLRIVNGEPVWVDSEIDFDGDGFTVAEGDCNDNDSDINPTEVEIMGDGIDNNCNGEIDESQIVLGQQEFTTPGSYTWTAPPGVTSVSVVAIGGGGGGGRNSDTGQTPGGDSYFIDASTVRGGGGGHGINAFGTFTGDGGGNGGYSNTTGTSFSGGGGAGGYSGSGGYGGIGNGTGTTQIAGSDGAGGGGGGGGWASGGGVGIYGQGPNGSGSSIGAPEGGGGGSGGVIGKTYLDGNSTSALIQRGGAYGGGGGSTYHFGGSGGGLGWKNNITVQPGTTYIVVVGDGGLPDVQWSYAGQGGSGAVRIIWGPDRSFPSTNTNDQ